MKEIDSSLIDKIPNACPYPMCESKMTKIKNSLFKKYYWVECTQCKARGPRTVIERWSILEWNQFNRFYAVKKMGT